MDIVFLPTFDAWALVKDRKPVPLPDGDGPRQQFWPSKSEAVRAARRGGYKVCQDGMIVAKRERKAKKRIAHRYERRLASRANVAAARMANVVFGPQFTEDANGRRIRVFTKDNWCTPEDVRFWLLGNRVVEIDDALEFVSEAVLRFLIKGDYLRKDPAAGFYWVTEKAARKYDLPPVLGCSFPQ